MKRSYYAITGSEFQNSRFLRLIYKIMKQEKVRSSMDARNGLKKGHFIPLLILAKKLID